MRKLIIFITFIIIIALNITSCRKSPEKKDVEAAKPTAQEEKVSDINLSFIQTAKTATLKKLGKRGYYTLTLYDTNPFMTYYSERPKRITGTDSVEHFIKAWNVGKNNFHDENPNALLEAAVIDGVINKGSTFYLLTCSTPHYEIQKGILSYIVKSMPKHEIVFDQIRLDFVTLLIN